MYAAYAQTQRSSQLIVVRKLVCKFGLSDHAELWAAPIGDPVQLFRDPIEPWLKNSGVSRIFDCRCCPIQRSAAPRLVRCYTPSTTEVFRSCYFLPKLAAPKPGIWCGSGAENVCRLDHHGGRPGQRDRHEWSTTAVVCGVEQMWGVGNENEGSRVGNSRLLTLSLYPWIPSNFRHSLNRRTSGAFISPVWIKHTGILATPKSTRMYVRSVTFSLDNSSPQA